MAIAKLIRLALGLLALVLAEAAHAACDQNGIGHAKPNTPKARMNLLKNRRIGPTTVKPVGVFELLHYPQQGDVSLEDDGVILRGQFLQAVHEGAESPNCGVAADFHIFIGQTDGAHPDGAHLTKAQVKARKKRAVVVELTPNIQDQQPAWGDHIQQLAGKNVCVTGWLLYDYEHHPQVGHTRGTLWEVHPITGISLLQPDGSCTPWQP